MLLCAGEKLTSAEISAVMDGQEDMNGGIDIEGISLVVILVKTNIFAYFCPYVHQCFHSVIY